MTENKRFTVKQRQGATIYSIIDYYGELPLSEGMYYKSNAEKLCKWLNTQHELLNAFCKENEQLKSKNRGLQSELQIFKEDITHSNLQINKLTDENEELKQQLKTRVIVNKQYEELQRLKKENEHIKNTIQEAYNNERTHIGKSVIQQLLEQL